MLLHNRGPHIHAHVRSFAANTFLVSHRFADRSGSDKASSGALYVLSPSSACVCIQWCRQSSKVDQCLCMFWHPSSPPPEKKRCCLLCPTVGRSRHLRLIVFNGDDDAKAVPRSHRTMTDANAIMPVVLRCPLSSLPAYWLCIFVALLADD